MKTIEFIEKLQKDEELQKKFTDVKEPEKFYIIAKENGLTDNFETMKEVLAGYVKENSENEDLNLETLAQVSGGGIVTEVVETIYGMAAFGV